MMGWGSVLLLVMLVPASASRFDASEAAGDEEFIRTLEAQGTDAGIDSKRLARLFFSLAATLNGGKSSVQLLQSGLRIRDASAESARAAMRARYFVYEERVGRFAGSAAALLEDPASRALLLRTLMDGHRACWGLRSYTQLAETYGLSSSRLLSILSSAEACERFGRAAFAEPVEAVLARALSDAAEREARMRVLEEELAEFELLLEDLRRIDDRQ
jgi:hypothetical protein